MVTMNEAFAPPLRFWDASDQAHEQAAKAAGAADFGGDDYREGLRILLLSMDQDPQFTERGRRIAWGGVVSALTARANAVRSMLENSGFDSAPLLSPIVITGIPRTGTTALHKLMAVDSQFQGLETWLNASPQPRPPRETWERNPLFHEMSAQLAARYAAVPGVKAAHEMAAEEVDECLFVLRQSFVSNLWNCGWSAPSFDAWWQNQSERASYEHYARIVRLVGSREPDKRWLLKNPGHIANLDHLLAVFPDARVIVTHRDPAKAVPSLTSLLMKGRPLMEDGDPVVHAHLMLARETEKWAKAVHSAERVRQQHRSQILDVIQSDFHARPMETIEQIYAFAGIELTADSRSAMLERIAADPEGQHGAHRYDISDFGMTESAIRERFGIYMAQFDLVRARR